MVSLMDQRTYRNQRSTLRLFAALTTLFFVCLAVGILLGAMFLRDAVLDERHKQAEIRIEGFTKALQTVIRQTHDAGDLLASELTDEDPPGSNEDQVALQSFLAAAPWTKAVIVRTPERDVVYPNDLSQIVQSFPFSISAAPDDTIVGPFTIPNGEKVFLYRFLANNSAVDLVINAADILEAVGFLELEQTTQFTVSTSLAETPKQPLVIGNANGLQKDAITRTLKLANASWTISVAPRPLHTGAHNWNRLLLFATAILAFAFLTPFLALIFLVRARLADNRNIELSMAKVENLSRQLDVALNASNIGLWEHDLETEEQIWDDQMMRIYGIEGESHIQSFENWLSRLHPEDQNRLRSFSWRDADNGKGFLTEYRIITPDGQEKSIRSAGNAFADSSGKKKFVGVNWDVSADKALQEALEEARIKAETQNLELEQARKRMEIIAFEDALTGIANRRHFERQLAASERDGALPAGTKIILIDLDDFKAINDTMGHFIGDEVLRLAARVFSKNLTDSDFLARTGGDEFVVLMPASGDADAFAQKVMQSFSQTAVIDGRSCRVGVSIGIATAKTARDSGSELLIKADLALYESKRLGRGRTTHFTHQLMTRTFSVKRIADELQEAVATGQIYAHFQPIFDIKTMRIIGVEALARWQHPDRGLLEPSSFLEIADSVGLIQSIDAIVFDKAMDMLHRVKAEKLDLPAVSINISAQRLLDPALFETLEKSIRPEQHVNFELLESIPFDKADQSLLETISALRARGFGIDLDDFGSGYASLVGLTQLRPDRVKIAGQLITPIIESEESLQIVQTISTIARTFGIGVICEGVASRAHSEKLAALGCNIQQGYHFSRPMDEEKFIAYLRARRD